MFMRIMWKLFRFFKSLIKRLYWLLAPDIMIRLGLRHAILFTILFITPSILRAFGNPLYYHSNQLFLRLTMGREWLREYNQLTNKLKNASSYQEFCEIGQKLDVMDGSFEWKTTQASKLYNHERINQDIVLLNKIIQTCRAYEENQKNFSSRSRLQQSQRRQQQQQRHESGIDTHPMRDLMEFLRSRAIRNYCGITNPQLYDKARVGTKELIQRFKNKVCDAFEYIASCNDPEITTAEKLVYFNECRHVFGRTALMLSGGAGLGSYHFGVVSALVKCGLVPKVLAGSSVGSIICAIVATHTDEEIQEFIWQEGKQKLGYLAKRKHDNWVDACTVRFRRLWKTGNLLDVTVLRDTVRANIGDLTFLEAFQKTGRILNVTVTGTDSNTVPRLLNFLTAPNVVIWSAVIASCAIPFVFAPQQLQVKETTLDSNNEPVTTIHPIFLHGVTFADGSIAHDLPMTQLQQLFNIDNFIVSQVNPHLVPFLFHSIKAPIPLFERLFHFLGNEFHLYLSSLVVNLREMGILRGLYYVNALIAQRYTGDVTIVPDVRTSDFLRLLSNPTHDYINHCSKISQRSTWKHICRLEALCSVEVCIEDCLHQLRAKALYLQQQSSLMSREIHQSQSQSVLQNATNININNNINNNNNSNSHNNNNNNNNNNSNRQLRNFPNRARNSIRRDVHVNNINVNGNVHVSRSHEMANSNNRKEKPMGRVSSFQTPNIDAFIEMNEQMRNENEIDHERSPWLNDAQKQNRLHIPQTLLHSLSKNNLLTPTDSHNSLNQQSNNIIDRNNNNSNNSNNSNNNNNINNGNSNNNNDDGMRICHVSKRGSIHITQAPVIDGDDSYPDSGISANVTPASIENELNIPRTMSLNELVSSDLGDIA